MLQAPLTAGIICWLGFTIKCAVPSPHKNQDPFGDAVYAGLSRLAIGGTMQDAYDDLKAELDQLVNKFDLGGSLNNFPGADMLYFAAAAMRDNVSLAGNSTCQPL